MAKQKGFIQIQGTLGDTTFAETKDGYQVRKKSRLTADRIKNSPAFARTRENNTEFGRAGEAGKLIRDSLATLTADATDANALSRLVKKCMFIIRHDLVSARGMRNLVDGPTAVLSRFDFNTNAVLKKVIRAPYSTVINRVTGELTINIPSFIPEDFITMPKLCTHFKIVSAGTEIDFEQKTYKSDEKQSAPIALDRTPTAVMNIVHNVTPNSTLPLFLVFGVQFFQLVAGSQYPMKNKTSNVLMILEVSKP